MWKRFVLIEAGVIRGGNYTWITNVLKNIAPECEFTTLTMYENVHSKFHSDIVGNVYDNEVEDLHFWWGAGAGKGAGAGTEEREGARLVSRARGEARGQARGQAHRQARAPSCLRAKGTCREVLIR